MWLWLVAQLAFADSTQCSSRALQRKDCELRVGAYHFRLLDQSVAWTDGVWRTVDPTPLNGEGTEWSKVMVAMMGSRPVLQMWIWDKGVGQANVQSLHWYVIDLGHKHFSVLRDHVVRKRRLNAQTQKPILDHMEPHSLKALPHDQLELHHGRHKEILKPGEPKHGV